MSKSDVWRVNPDRYWDGRPNPTADEAIARADAVPPKKLGPMKPERLLSLWHHSVALNAEECRIVSEWADALGLEGPRPEPGKPMFAGSRRRWPA